jgi:hypothetical protein
MEDYVHSARCGTDAPVIRDVARDHFHLVRERRGIEPAVRAERVVVNEGTDGGAELYETFGQVASDETARTGNEDFGAGFDQRDDVLPTSRCARS